MTSYRFVTLTCDGCGEIFDPGTARTVSDCRRYARAYGWANRGLDDRCGVCEGTYEPDPLGADMPIRKETRA